MQGPLEIDAAYSKDTPPQPTCPLHTKFLQVCPRDYYVKIDWNKKTWLLWRLPSGAKAHAVLHSKSIVTFHSYDHENYSRRECLSEHQLDWFVTHLVKCLMPEAEQFGQRYLAIKKEVEERKLPVTHGYFPTQFKTKNVNFELRADGKLDMALIIHTQPYSEGCDIAKYRDGLIFLRGECHVKAALDYLDNKVFND